MNIILFDRTDYYQRQDTIRLSDYRFDHISKVLKPDINDTLKVGLINGNMGTGKVLEINERYVDISVKTNTKPPPPCPLTILLAMPGGNFVVEACSPTYAKLAISSTRLDHAPALPCEIAFKAINGGTELLVSYLDPNFMFDIMFADMTDVEKEALGNLPGVVLKDLQNIVNYSFENDLDILLSNGMQVEYDMLQD